jgi:hypothetical protein
MKCLPPATFGWEIDPLMRAGSTTNRRIRFLLLLLTFASGLARATTEYSKTINQLGVQNATPGGYFSVVEGLTLSCQYSNIYFDFTTPFGQDAYAQLLTAKNTGRMLSRIDYTQPGGTGTTCLLSLVEVQN